MRNNIELIRQVCSQISSIGEVITGNENERKVIDLLREFLDEYIEELKLYPINVMSWCGEYAEVHVGDIVLKATPLPYSPSGNIDGKIIYVGNSIERKGLSKKDVEGKILLYESFDDVDEIESQYLEALDYGALGFIVFDKYSSVRRKIVIKGEYEYRFEPSTPPPIPAVHLKREDGLKLLKLINNGLSTVRIDAKCYVKHGAIGYNLEAYILHGREHQVIVTAHHDHWFSGIIDNILGIALLTSLVKDLKKKLSNLKIKNTLKMVSFTAEESGAPYYAGWYWIYGSRKYVERLRNKGEIDNIVLVLNVDALGKSKLDVHISSPILSPLVKRMAEKYVDNLILHDSPYFDSFSFSYFANVPTITFTSFDYIAEVYHTDRDNLENVEWNIIDRACKALMALVNHVISSDVLRELDYLGYIESIYNEALNGNAPLDLKLSIYRLYDYVKGAIKSMKYNYVFKVLNKLNGIITSPIFEGEYKTNYGKFKVLRFPFLLIHRDIHMIEKALNYLERDEITEAIKCLKQIPARRIEPGVERIISEINIPPLATLLQLHGMKAKIQAMNILKEMKDSLSACISNAVNKYIAIIDNVCRELYEVINN